MHHQTDEVTWREWCCYILHRVVRVHARLDRQGKTEKLLLLDIVLQRRIMMYYLASSSLRNRSFIWFSKAECMCYSILYKLQIMQMMPHQEGFMPIFSHLISQFTLLLPLTTPYHPGSHVRSAPRPSGSAYLNLSKGIQTGSVRTWDQICTTSRRMNTRDERLVSNLRGIGMHSSRVIWCREVIFWMWFILCTLLTTWVYVTSCTSS